ncbi:MAG: substrate-binding domain-containing protein [Victivallaceae bacterium]
MEKAVPKYQQIRDRIQLEIRRGRYLPGSPFLSLLELSGEYGVSNITARRIVRELEEAHYLECRKGNRPVVRLPQQDIPRLRKNVGLLLTDPEFDYRSAPWAHAILSRLQERLFSHGNSLMLFGLNNNFRQKLEFCDALIMLQPMLEAGNLELIHICNMPLIGIASYLPERCRNVVGLDFTEAAKTAANSILRHGMKNIICVLQPGRSREWFIGRYATMWPELEKSGVSLYRAHFFETAIDEAAGEALMRQLLASGLPEKAVFLTLSDFVAIGICRAALAAGLKPQRDFMVLGSAGLPETLTNDPALSTFCYPPEQLTDRAIELLYGQINNRELVCPGELLPVSYSERST